MLKLMQQCNLVDKQRDFSKRFSQKSDALYIRNTKAERDVNIQNVTPAKKVEEANENRGILSGNPFSLLSGVFPGL